LNSTLDLAELTQIILQIVRDEVGVERGTVFVMTPDRQHLRSLVAQEVDVEIELKVGAGIAGAVADNGEVIDIPDAYKDDRFDRSFDAQLDFKTRDIYCMPVRNRTDSIVGVWQLLNRSRSLTKGDKDFLAGMSVHIGLALKNAAMHREILEKKKIEQQLDLAREIQQTFQPDLPDAHGEVEIFGSSDMCHEVGGDYMSFFPLQDGRFIAMLGDVSGKGIGVALVMTSVHAMCRALVRHVHSLERISFILNEMLLETQNRSYLTLLIVLVDPVKSRMHFINAGHNPPVLVDGKGIVRMLDQSGGPPVGLFPGLRHSREIIDVDPGSVLAIYSDGVSEAENAEEEQFDMDRFSIVLQKLHKQSAKQIHTGVREALKDFVGDNPANDDSTMMVLKF
jgi:sigma-B regulation protein RsbU (phosphoserine phosphatase)